MFDGFKSVLRAWQKPRSVLIDGNRLEVSAGGFAIIGPRHPVSINWADVTSVHAYKRDLLTSDIVCLRFTTGEASWQVHEEMPGYSEWLESSHEQLGVSPDWIMKVMFPPFENNLMQIYPALADGTD